MNTEHPELGDDTAGLTEWMAYWDSLTEDQRAAEIAMMDAHVADQQRRRDAGEPA